MFESNFHRRYRRSGRLQGSQGCRVDLDLIKLSRDVRHKSPHAPHRSIDPTARSRTVASVVDPATADLVCPSRLCSVVMILCPRQAAQEEERKLVARVVHLMRNEDSDCYFRMLVVARRHLGQVC